MSVPHVSHRLVVRIYRTVRILVRLVYVLVFLGVLLFVYLRIQGVPGPLLREVMRRANEAGIPVSVEGITLTLNGWRADRVRYYSNHPDDLEPMFESEHVFFSAQRNGGAKGVNVEVRAVDVRISPSVEWGVSIPAGGGCRNVDQIEVMLGFRPDRIVLSGGKMEWLGSRFNVNGFVLKRKGGARPAPPSARRQATVSPVVVTAAQFLALENRLKMLSLPTGATIDIDFKVDMGDYSASRLDFVVLAEDLAFRNIGFSKAEVSGSYAHPALRIECAGLFQGKQSLQASGEYNLDSGEVEGTLYNSITSNQLMLLLPAGLHDLLSRAKLRIDHLPRVEIDFGPAPAKALLNHLSGTFSIRGVGYQGLEIEALDGRVARKNNRIEFTHLRGLLLGQEDRAEEAGSSMRGGSAEGEVFWDGNTREFGVDIDASLDPNLLVQALSPVRIATNIIQSFSFKDQPPRGHVALGANVDDGNTFYIDIQAVANDVAFRGVGFSSINVTQTYRNGKLGLDPIAVVQGAEFAKGSIEVDFRNDTVSFDAESRLTPAALEDVICPQLNLFGGKIKTEGVVRLSARGRVDWGSMDLTDFSAKVYAEKLKIPVGVAHGFQAELVGAGTLLSVRDAKATLYGGAASGSFHIQLDPVKKKTMPYGFDATFAKVDFKKFVEFFSGEKAQLSGKLSGHAHIEADMATNFFSSVNGAASIRVDDGQLADLPLFKGFSKVVRKMIPGFSTFSITSLKGDFILSNGAVSSKNLFFKGDIINATGRGRYYPDSGFDAKIQVHILGNSGLLKVVRVITDPLTKFFEMKLTGSLSEPSWQLDKFTKDSPGKE
jgi:hypothetical protein